MNYDAIPYWEAGADLEGRVKWSTGGTGATIGIMVLRVGGAFTCAVAHAAQGL